MSAAAPGKLDPADERELRALWPRLRRTTLVRPIVANAVGAAVAVTYNLALNPRSAPPNFHLAEALGLFFAYFAVAAPVADAISLRLARGPEQALNQGRLPTERERAKLFSGPRRAAALTLAAWTVGAILFSTYDALRFGDSAGQATKVGLIILLGGLTTSALVFQLNEAPMRPVYAIVFRLQPPTRAAGLGVGVRLILSWVLGSGVPLLGIALALLGVGAPHHEALRRAVLVLVVAGLVAGWLITLRAARSVAEPLDTLRSALGRVRRGDLDVEVAVDDVTEVGLLQAGFNEMVAGLRERVHLEDLFGRYVGVEVAREALARGIGLGGELRQVSALFVDIVGSTRLALAAPPQEVVTMINAVFDAVVRSVTAEGGWLNKFEGDAALCVFGAPLEQTDHAARALRAACALRRELIALGDRHPGLDAGIGVSSGEVVAGTVGAEERFEYTVIGDPVNEASRLTDEAKKVTGRVLASARTVEAAGDQAADWRRSAVLTLRGRSEPTVAYQPAADEAASATGTPPGAAPAPADLT